MSPLNSPQRSTSCSSSADAATPTMHSACSSSSTPDTSQRTGREYWRSIDELADTPEFHQFVQREFPAAGDLLESADRRSFLKIMSASMALAGMGLAGCRRWPETYLAPFANAPADRKPGVPVHYATSMDFAGVGCGLLVTSYDGRPIKIEGNPQHPINKGSTTLAMQAAILDMYDQDRSRFPVNAGEASSWEQFSAWAKPHFESLASAGGAGLAILSEATSSPSVAAMKQRFMSRFPQATWHEYEAINNDNALAGSQVAFGGAYRPMYDFAAAKTILSLDCDFLGAGTPASLKWTRDYAASRRCDDGAQPSRLYAFEGVLSLTGANADHRIALRSSDIAKVAAWIASQVGVSGVPDSLASANVAPLGDTAHLQQVLSHLVEDLKHGPSVVLVGDRQPAEVHLLGHLINRALGNIGRTVTFAPLAPADSAVGHVASITQLVQAMNAGSVQSLVILGGNPVYNAPSDLDFVAALKKVQHTIHLADYTDETSRACTWHLNRAHFLEAWGDVRAWDGTWGIIQPLILPLFDGKTVSELLALIAGEQINSSYEITRAVFAANIAQGGDMEDRWRKTLNDGFVEGSAWNAAAAPEVAGLDLASHMAALEQRVASDSSGFELVFVPDSALYDGRLANNGWLQELPDPIAKLTWDNALLISATAARNLNVKTGDMVEIAAHGKRIAAAVMIVPGTHDQVASLALGYGRGEEAGRVAHRAGFNVYPLRTTGAMGFTAATISRAADEGSYVLATTQDHHPIDAFPAGIGTQERLPSLFREASLKHYREHPDFAKHRTHVVTRLSLFPEDHPFQVQTMGADGQVPAEYAWAMSIDLNACTGCNACVIACQAENNIAIVGKDQVKRGREMHWIRVDRYYKGTSEANPSGYMLSPVNCMQCENAPCEQVCPVAATVHDTQGLNVMVYNRCIGTRYCSNNCPYKVRRFNYFDWWGRGPLREQPGVLLQVEPDYYMKGQAKADPIRQMGMNPEVTVRMRGIMEKCTYCVQRIMRARIDAKNKWVRDHALNPEDPTVAKRRVPVPDGSFTTACASACPAEAIVFGDLNDQSSRVRAMHKHQRCYEMLEELNTKPRTRYLAKIRNPAFGGDEPAHNGHGSHGDTHGESHGEGHDEGHSS